jgi:hypothetical protein
MQATVRAIRQKTEEATWQRLKFIDLINSSGLR